MSSSSESEAEIVTTPPDIVNAAKLLNENLLPAKSKDRYNAAHENFIKWKMEKNTSSFSENVLLAYFGEIATKYKPSTLWAIYSMLKSTLKPKNCIDIEKYIKLKVFLKRQSDGYTGKKSKILTGENVENFCEAPYDTYLATKVALILGVTGALRRQELSDITINDVENQGEMLLVRVPHTKNKIPRSFVVSGEYYRIVKKYQNLRSPKGSSNRFFQHFRNGKCTAQVIGRNKFGSMPKEIAQYLNLPDAASYTGHTFRRTSATLLADSGVDILTLKRHGGWKSSSVAEGYIDDSINSKKQISLQISNSIRSCGKVMPECHEPIASTSTSKIKPQTSTYTIEPQPSTSWPEVEPLLEPPEGCVPGGSEGGAFPAGGEQATNITNLSQAIKFPEKKMVLNFSNNSNCTITLNFNK